jgi:hypothetical protein
MGKFGGIALRSNKSVAAAGETVAPVVDQRSQLYLCSPGSVPTSANQNIYPDLMIMGGIQTLD